jgi:hypothetical protein
MMVVFEKPTDDERQHLKALFVKGRVDVVVKSGGITKHLADLRKILECTRKHGLKMNPNKYVFGVSACQFLGFMVH